MSFFNIRKNTISMKHRERRDRDHFSTGIFGKAVIMDSKTGIIRSGFIITCMAAVISGILKAAAIIPFALSFFWYIEQKGVDGIVDAGLSFLQKKMYTGNEIDNRLDSKR
jgi:hypothetical protein